MSAAIAMAPSPAPHDRPSFGGESAPAAASSSAAAPAPSASHSPSVQRTSITGTPNATAAPSHQQHSTRTGSGSPRGSHSHGTGKSSPPSASRNAGGPPRIIVKKEPGSPEIPASRHRPRKLDLSKNVHSQSPATARPYTARDGNALGIQEVGLACLSPGFITQDPTMKEQVQRSMSVREQQRHLIEARLQQQSAKGDGPSDKDKDASGAFAAKTPGMSRRNKAPPGLSIVAPNHEHFANERVIQSAPLGQTFTGMNNPHPLTRHIENRPSKLSNTSHIHHVPANQTNNRLPPISDVFGQQLSAHPASQEHAMYQHPSAGPQPTRSPNHSHHPHPPPSAAPARPREYKSAEEAQHELAGGRPELLPKLVHYGGHQPPTPPSPLPGVHRPEATRSHSATKRRRDEYEAGVSPPLGNGRPSVRRGPFGEGRDSPETQRAKRDEFLRLCERAWDLFHS